MHQSARTTERRRSLVVHGHFYQPPREDPWTGAVPVEPSAAPYHDWNHRIHDECYRAVVAARLLDGEGRIASVVNTLEWISWDAGPTLLEWLARETPSTYRAMLEGDARSAARLGHGNALAAPYHHVILPLASRRDKVAEVRWGIADFRRRFGRDPAGMWLPEAAVDMETLEVLALEGIRFTILGPGQVVAPPANGEPRRVDLPGKRSLAVFVYDGELSHGVAFGKLLGDAHAWIQAMASAGPRGRRIIGLATDGETFGHHRPWGDMALAAAVVAARARSDVRLDNFASLLARRHVLEPIEIVEPSSWSCAHGVERWRSDCGCKIAPERPSQQAWRGVLRDALDELAAGVHSLFEREGSLLFADPWAAREAFGGVRGAGGAAAHRFVQAAARQPLSAGDAARALELLEMEWDALAMFTSCGWFFDDIAGIEPLQILRYAARVIDLAGPAGPSWEARFRERLALAPSNDPAAGDGARLWEERVRGHGRQTGTGAARPAGRSADLALGWRAAGFSEDPVSASVRAAVIAAAQQFVRAPDAAGAEGALRAIDALAALGLAVPFEAQSAFGRALPDLGAVAPDEARVVAERLGFARAALTALPHRAGAPVDFVFGLHVHQPVGNFDEVFESHAEDVYLRFLRRIAEGGALPIALHVSGPLLEWLEARRHEFLDLVGTLVADGSVELLLSGFYEPVLPALSRPDRLEQIGWMKDWLRSRFGVEARGLWLTERVWEPGLAEDLADAGVSYVLVDDRHFLVTGYERHQLHQAWRTEAGGKGLSVLPIDERLRYLVPFRPPEELAAYLRSLQARQLPLAVLADDGEKFGGWPGTATWVWEDGWLERYLDVLHDLVDDGVVRLTTPSRALEAHPPTGLAYLPTASYREMEGWSLPRAAAIRLEHLEHTVHDDGASSLIRGGHWTSFLSKYPESNRMHKKTAALSELCWKRGNPPDARRAIGRAQCNDAYWHGVFGGLYLRHLRAAIWSNLAEAEEMLRRGEPIDFEAVDLDQDGQGEIWIHSATFSARLVPTRGGSIEELTSFAARKNLADVLTRRREAYHRAAATTLSTAAIQDGGMPSIHALEGGMRFTELPPLDAEDRAILVDRVLPADLDSSGYALARYTPLQSWAKVPFRSRIETAPHEVTVHLACPPPAPLDKRVSFSQDGTVEVTYRWDAAAFPHAARFAPELSLSETVELQLHPEPEDVWSYEIKTSAKSERGAEEAVQGVSLTPLWPSSLGEARLRFRAPGSR